MSTTSSKFDALEYSKLAVGILLFGLLHWTMLWVVGVSKNPEPVSLKVCEHCSSHSK